MLPCVLHLHAPPSQPNLSRQTATQLGPGSASSSRHFPKCLYKLFFHLWPKGCWIYENMLMNCRVYSAEKVTNCQGQMGMWNPGRLWSAQTILCDPTVSHVCAVQAQLLQFATSGTNKPDGAFQWWCGVLWSKATGPPHHLPLPKHLIFHWGD